MELNPAIIELVRRSKDFAGDVYDQPGVALTVGEGRRFLMTHPQLYDLIQMSLVLTATPQSGTFALAEGYLYTREAHRLYLNRLRPGGFLSIIDDHGTRNFRQLITSLSVLEEGGRGTGAAMRHAAVIENTRKDGMGYRHLLLISPTPISEASAERILTLSRSRGLTPLWVPGRVARAPFDALARMGRMAFLAAHPLELSPPTDEHPFFFYFGKGARGYFSVVRTLGVVALLSAFLAALFARRHKRALGAQSWRPLLAAFLLGAAFMCLEGGLLQRLTLAAGGPTEIFAILLFSLLFWCGLGSRLACVLGRRFSFGLPEACVGAMLAALAAYFVLGEYYTFTGARSPLFLRAGIFFSLAPVGLILGGPFPFLLARYVRGDEKAAAVLWGVNGLASVCGAMLTIALPVAWGVRANFLAGGLLYGAAAWITRGGEKGP
ncbi:MAG: hypothetical protein ABII00_06205 [Elusimicrobiota bacterium]